MFYKLTRCFILISLAVASILIISSCDGNKNNESDLWVQKEGLIWNTSYHVTFCGPEELGDSIIATLNNVGKSLSCFDSTSLVSKVNRQDSTPVNDDFIRVYVMSRKINKATNGAFDPTLSPLIRAWGFGEGHKPTSDTLHIDSLLNLTGIARTRLYRDALIKENPNIQFNFSAIAKGYGCDAIGEMFERNGVDRYLIEIGGEILAKGKNQQGEEWKISIDKPVSGEQSSEHLSQAIIAFTNMGMATSGNYRNNYNDGTRTYGHTISSKTGRPVQTDILSATVLASTSMEADGLATAFMSMNKKDVEKFVLGSKMPVMLILEDSTVWCSESFEKLIVK